MLQDTEKNQNLQNPGGQRTENERILIIAVVTVFVSFVVIGVICYRKRHSMLRYFSGISVIR